MQPVAVLRDDMGYFALFIEHKERHVGRGGLGQSQVAGSNLLALQSHQSYLIDMTPDDIIGAQLAIPYFSFILLWSFLGKS